MEEALELRLYGDETFEELMQIKETLSPSTGEPPIKKYHGGIDNPVHQTLIKLDHR